MSGFGTDILAIACIAGSAAASGAVTLAFLDGPGPAQANCAMEEISVIPNVVVSGRTEAGAMVMTTPRVRLHATHGCREVVSETVRIRMEDMTREMENVRIRIEGARRGAEGARMRGEMMRIRADELRHVLEEARERSMEAGGAMEEARLQEIQFLLQKVEKGSGGQME